MADYRELHFSSKKSARTDGTRSHPRYIFKDSIHLTKFCLRNAQIPFSWWTIPNDELLYYYDGTKSWVLTIPANCYTAESLRALLENQITTSDAVSAGVTVVLEEVCGKKFLNFVDPVADSELDFSSAPKISYFVGLPIPFSDPVVLSIPSWFRESGFAIRPNEAKYIYMHSNMARGASFTPNNLTSKGIYNSSDVIAKIPFDTTNVPENQYLWYSANDAPSITTMFSYYGDSLEEMDIYFTAENSDEKLDFNGFDFSCTLGILTPRESGALKRRLY